MKIIRVMDKMNSGINEKQPPRPLAFRRRRGASLAEMLIAIVVLAVVLISMLGMFVISRTAVVSKDDETGLILALRYLEDLEQWDFPDYATELPKEWNDQKYKITATYIQNESDDFRAKIRVVVTWRGAAPGKRSVELDRIISSVGYRNVGQRTP